MFSYLLILHVSLNPTRLHLDVNILGFQWFASDEGNKCVMSSLFTKLMTSKICHQFNYKECDLHANALEALLPQVLYLYGISGKIQLHYFSC